MSYVTSGFAEVIFKSRVTAGYREMQTALGFSIAGFDPVAGPGGIFAAWGTFIGSMGWPSTAFATGVEIRVGTADPSAPLVYEAAGSDAGSGAAALISPNVSLLATKRTLLGGRQGRGRMYLGPPREGEVTDEGVVGGTYLVGVQTALDTLVADVETIIGGDAYLLHSGPSPAPTLIQSITIQDVVATQRRRLSRGS